MKKPAFQTGTAKRLRRTMTPAEVLIWDILRAARLASWKFRRQQPIGPYIADFVCFSTKVIVELDGDSHIGREDHDAKRDRYLAECGYLVLRFENFETRLDENHVVEMVAKACRDRDGLGRKSGKSKTPSPLTPLPPGEGGTSKHKIALTPLPPGEGGTSKATEVI